MSFELLAYVVLVFTAFVGVLLTIYIHHKKRTKEAMVCPLHGHCEQVITSEFSTFLGLPVELLGMFYYSAVAVGYGVLLGVPEAQSTLFTLALFFMTGFAFLFSGYLVSIQAFYLHQWCTWCLFSALISAIIFLITFFVSGWQVLLILTDYLDILASLYAFALALGLGSATLLFVFLIKFLRDLHISVAEADVIRTISQAIWMALFVLVLSGSAIYLAPDALFATYAITSAQLILLGMTVLFMGALSLMAVPRLISISLQLSHDHRMGELRGLRRSAFGLSVGALVSWYMILLSFFFLPAWGLQATFALYAAVLLVAFGISQLLEMSWRLRQ